MVRGVGGFAVARPRRPVAFAVRVARLRRQDRGAGIPLSISKRWRTSRWVTRRVTDDSRNTIIHEHPEAEKPYYSTEYGVFPFNLGDGLIRVTVNLKCGIFRSYHLTSLDRAREPKSSLVNLPEKLPKLMYTSRRQLLPARSKRHRAYDTEA